MSVDQVACTYTSLILHDEDISIKEDKIATLVSSAGVTVQAYWPGLFAKLLQKRNVNDLITNFGSGGGSAPVAVAATVAGGGGAAAEPVDEDKKEEPKEESDDDMGFSLFD